MERDWVGTKAATFRTLAASNHTEGERQEHDLYATSPEAVKIWLNERKPTLTKRIIEPCAGLGHMAEPLKDAEYNVFCADLIQRDYPLNKVWNFLELPENQQNTYDIVMNPPYRYASEFIQKALAISTDDVNVWAFVKLLFLEGKERRESLYNNGYLKEVDVYTGRVNCAKNGDFETYKSSAVCYAFMCFSKKKTNTEPIIKWIN